jgi:peptide-methionine (R)-S-oxide reductase
MLNWKDVIHFTVAGNPEPDHRVEKPESEWRDQLTPQSISYHPEKGHGSASFRRLMQYL